MTAGAAARAIRSMACGGNPGARGLLAIGLALVASAPSFAGVFIFNGETTEGTTNVELITHPTGYDGTSGTINVDVCIDPDDANIDSTLANDMEIPLRNAVGRYNDLVPTTGNLSIGSTNNIPSDQVDFESVMLHEIGHCIGMGHPNLATESGFNDNRREATATTDGINDSDPRNTGDYDVDAGPDGLFGSADDQRGDDRNLHWFRISNNNPFSIASTVDSGTYSRILTDLPTGENFAVNARRALAGSFGVASNTEAVMQQGTVLDEAQRTLGHDDVAMLRYGMSGLDEIAGSGNDDYTISLSFGGESNGCDVMIRVNNSTALARCGVQGDFVTVGDDRHAEITSATIEFNNKDVDWFFNDVLTAGSTPTANSDAYSTDEDMQLTVGAPGILDNDTDPNGDSLSAKLVSGVSHGTLNLSSDGSFDYTPNSNFNGSDSFTYVANDGSEDSNEATVSLTVDAVNDAPTADSDSYDGFEQKTLEVGAPGVLGNDNDVDGDSLAASVVDAPTDGSLTLNTDGSFRYEPDAGFDGTDSFTYSADDGNGGSDQATVTINIAQDLYFKDSFGD